VVVAVLVFILLLFSASVQATDRYVASCTNGISTYNPTTGSCTGGSSLVYSTAQNASTVAVAGDTVYFRAGTYAGFTVANSGTAGNYITFRNYTGETVTISGSPPDCGTGDGTSMICVNAVNYVEINGLILHGSGTSTSGIQISHAAFINLLNSEIRYSGQTGVAIYYADTHDILVQNNVWHDNIQGNIEQSGQFRQGTCQAALGLGGCSWGAGFVAGYGTYNINVIDNVSYFNHGEGLTIAGSNSVVRGNIVTDNWSANLYCTACFNTTFERNFAYTTPDFAAYPLMPVYFQNRLVYEGLSISSGDPGVHDLTGIIVANNILGGGLNRWQYGTVFSDNGNQVLNNTMITSPGAIGSTGLWWQNPGGTVTNLVVRNNLIHRTANGSGVGAIQLNDISSAAVNHNIYYDTTGTTLIYNGVTYGSYASWASASGDSSSFVANPLLVDGSAVPCRLWVDPRGGLGAPCSIATARAQTANYAPQAGSQAIDNGADLGSSYSIDYAGATRNAPWDIGALEYGASVSATLVAAYSLDEGSGLPQDTSGNGNHAQSMTGATWTTTGCKYGNCLTFDGSGSAIVPASASLALSRFTLSAWVKPTVTPPTVFATAVSHGPPGYYYLYTASESYLCGNIVDFAPGGGYGVGDLHACDNATLTQNTWYYLTVTYDGATIKFYRDGVLQNTSTPSSSLTADQGLFYIGATAFGEYFTGLIDDIRIYDGALTQTQIQDIMAIPVAPGCPSVPNALVASYGFEGNGTDSTLNGHTAVLGTGWSYTTGKYGQGAISTGASGITVADADALDMCGGFTYEGWINIPNTSGEYAFIAKNPGSSFIFASLSGYCGAGHIVGGYGAITGNAIACYGSAPITTGSLQHLAVTYDASLSNNNVKVYLNGSVVTTVDGTTLLTSTTGTLQFCGSSFSEICPSGTIVDEVRVYNYARSGAEVLTDSVTPIELTVPATPTGFKLK
jgi:Concanavalin A-like lectin/glucanases superfamily